METSTITEGLGVLSYFLPHSLDYRTIDCSLAYAGGEEFVVDPMTGDLMDRFSISGSQLIVWEPRTVLSNWGEIMPADAVVRYLAKKVCE